MYLNILLLPLLSSFICGIFGRILGHNGVKIVSLFCLFFTSCLSLLSFIEVIILKAPLIIHLWKWFNISTLSASITLQFDLIVCSMLLLISLVSFFVHLFSTSYMNEDPHLPRFMSYLSLFTFFMIVLVTSDNLIQLFIGWEGVGLCSYLLISFWFTRIQANKSAIKAMIINKIGDLGLLLGIITIWFFMGTISYSGIFSVLDCFQGNEFVLEIISLLLLIGVIGKSAQIGLHTWLPDAMEGPTPVSALIHAATMVTAGVFLIIRMSPLFDCCPSVLIIIVFIGSLTAFFSATVGLCQNDLKKVIAYSTCSQLGYMVMICGFSYYHTSLFHLINHGFFKALLFLSAGSIIHALSDEQDIRKMGGINFIVPFSYICIFIGSISLMGLPFMTGFYSKDLILEIIYGEYFLSYAFWLGVIAAFMTAFYSFRLIYYTFFSDTQEFVKSFKNIHEGDLNLLSPLLFLLIFSITLGYFLQFFILNDEEPIIITNFSKFIPLIFSLVGAIISLHLGYKGLIWMKVFTRKILIKVYVFFNAAWYFDNIFNHYLVKPIMKAGFSITYKLIDNQILENLGPSKMYNIVTNNSGKIGNYYLGKISTYLLSFVIFIFCILYKF